MIANIVDRIRSRIAYKLVLWAIVISLLITLLTSAIQLYSAYKQDMESIEDYFDSITLTQLKSLSHAVWIMDDNQIQAHLDGLTRTRDIIYAAIEIDGRHRWQSGANSGGRTLESSYELYHVHRGVQHDIGRLQVVANLENLFARLQKTAMVILLTNGVRTFLFAACILFLVQHGVTRHLEKIAAHVLNIDFRTKLEPLRLDRGERVGEDEFSLLVNMLNLLQRRGFNAFKALEKSDTRLRLFLDATEEGIFGINSEGRIIFANSTCLEQIGAADSREVIGKRVEDVFRYSSTSQELSGGGREIFKTPLATGKSMVSDDGILRIQQNRAFFAAVRAYPIVTDDRVTGVVVFVNDISEQHEILKEKNLLSQAVRQSPLVVIIFDTEGRIEYVNPGFEELIGYSQKEVLGKRALFLGHHRNNRTVYREIRNTLVRKRKWQGKVHVRARDGQEYNLDTIISPVLNNRGEMVNVIGLCLDITQKVALQNQLLHAQKMEAVGRISASFAHEFGNPLLGVRSVIKDIGERASLPESDRHLLSLAYDECERMRSLIRDFQRLQSDTSDVREYEDIHVLLDNVLLFYSKHIENNNIELKKKYCLDMPMVLVNKNQISQVFLNLIINAVDAMENGGGLLEVATHHKSMAAHIDLRDTGVGIGESEKDLIFEPFYTTKGDIHGSGLGLSVSYGIVAGHGGDIEVSSVVGRGTVFSVRLPLSFERV